MGGQQGGQQGGMMQGQGLTGMTQTMTRMAGMIQNMSAMMQGGLSAEAMREMSGITKDLSAQMMDMSSMLGRGDVSQSEMQDLQQRMMETENRLKEIR